jgi:hypothetical protein
MNVKDNKKLGNLHNGEIYTSHWSLTQSISACKGDLIDNILLFSAMTRDTVFQTYRQKQYFLNWEKCTVYYIAKRL